MRISDWSSDVCSSDLFGATTMSSIAALVGGSKTTLWTYFPSKEELFAAVVDDIVAVHAKALSTPLPIDQPIAEVLERFAISLLASILSPKVIGLHRSVETGSASCRERVCQHV